MHWFDRFATRTASTAPTPSTASAGSTASSGSRSLSRRGFLGSLVAVGGGAVAATLPSTAASAATCGPDRILCDSLCINPDKDPENCGSCGNACAPGETCSNGICCPCGWTNCSGTCIDLRTTPGHCGSCGHACKSGDICRDGHCVNPDVVSCTSDADCGVSNDCVTYYCTTGICGATFAPVGTVTADQTVGNCLTYICDGHGDIVSQVNDSNTPPNTSCAQGICTDGTPSTVYLASGTSCPGGICDGNGNCIACESDADCGSSTACVTFYCTEGMCSSVDAPDGTSCPGGTCDGNGTCIAV